MGRAVLGLLMIGLDAATCWAAPNTFLLQANGAVSPDSPTVTIELWAAFNPDLYAFGQSLLDMRSGSDVGTFGAPDVLLNDFPWNDPGEITDDGDAIAGIFAKQIHLDGGLFADPSNPILLWTCTWTTDDFTPRDVPLWTETERFLVILRSDDSLEKDFVGLDFEEGAAVITVVPSPTAAVVLSLASLGSFRRKRFAYVLRSSNLYCTASETCSLSTRSLPARSAMVRETRRILS
jgi:hypothetical protein